MKPINVLDYVATIILMLSIAYQVGSHFGFGWGLAALGTLTILSPTMNRLNK